MATAYWELLKDPRWQKKRLEILERDGFACQRCSASDKELHVHHSYYLKGHKPWEYPDGSLVTFCKDCHEAMESQLDLLKQLIGKIQVNAPWELDQITGFAAGMLMMLDIVVGPLPIDHDVSPPFSIGLFLASQKPSPHSYLFWESLKELGKVKGGVSKSFFEFFNSHVAVLEPKREPAWLG